MHLEPPVRTPSVSVVIRGRAQSSRAPGSPCTHVLDEREGADTLLLVPVPTPTLNKHPYAVYLLHFLLAFLCPLLVILSLTLPQSVVLKCHECP